MRRSRFIIGLVGAGCLAAAAVGQRQVSTSVKDGKSSEGNVPPGSAYAMPNNLYGAHLLVDDALPGTRGYNHLRWARHLVGRWGYAKTLFMGIDSRTRGPASGWVDYVNACYEMEMIPLVRLAGKMKDGQWVAPEPDRPGDYGSLAKAIKQVVERLPRSELCPLYVEIWNEPNLAVEWTGKPNPQEYADFFVQAAAAIRSIGDERIRILNGGLATSPEWAEKLCRANPEFIKSFDVWAAHPYPHNHAPSINFHDKTVPPGTDLTIDAYMLELDVLKRMGRSDVKVMLTETGYDLGNAARSGQPIIDEYNRADYIMRAFRDYWPKWPEIVAVFPFEFCNEGWERFDWVYPDSGTNDDGSPTQPHYQYTVVAALAKPTDTTGAVNGTLTIDKLGTRLEGARASVHLKGVGAESDSMGNFFLSRLTPGTYRVVVNKDGFATVEKKVTVTAGTNTVLDLSLVPKAFATLAGTVRSGDDGDPLHGVELKLEPGGAKTTTDPSGRYQFKDCVPGRYTVLAEKRWHQHYASAPVDVQVTGRNRHDFVLGKKESPSAENLLSNGGIEAGGGGGAKPGIALGFEPFTPGPAEFRASFARIGDRHAHTGAASQELQIRTDETAVRQITHYGTAKPGAEYVAGAWVRVNSADKDAAAWISLALTENGGGVIRMELSKQAKGRSDKWVWLETRCKAPANSQRVSVGLHTKGPKGTACFDDVYLGILQESK